MKTKHYPNGEITIVWKPEVCIHSTKCWRGDAGLIEVFNPKERPWIKPEGATTERIIAQIEQCPSGALSYFRNDTSGVPETPDNSAVIAEVLANGPLLVHGTITLKDVTGKETACDKTTAFCRCGNSANKPYCDGSHVKHEFKG